MKVIFLDVDGVINCRTTKERIRGYIGVEQEKIALIREIVDATNAKIVLSSTWRLDYIWHKEDKSVNLDTYNYLEEELAKQALDIFDVTPRHNDSWRGREIQDWIDNCGQEIESYVVIDDEIYDISKEHKGHIIQTSWSTGIKPNAVKMSIDILNKNDEKCD